MGTYQIMVGASISDIRLTTELEVEGTTSDYPYNPYEMPYYYTGLIQQITDQEFETLLGHPIPDGSWSGKLTVNDAICQMYYAKSRVARFVYKRLTTMKTKAEESGKPDLNILFIYNMPFRAIAKMTGGMVSMDMVHGIVDVVNGNFFSGMKQIISGYFTNLIENRKLERKLEKGK